MRYPFDAIDSALRDNQQLLEFVREAHGLCEAYGDIANGAGLEAIVNDAESRVWQLVQVVRSD